MSDTLLKEKRSIEKDIRKKRESGIELLRILAMCGVVLLHINEKALPDCTVGSGNYYILETIESINICAVDLFIMISGYFLCVSQKRVLLKPLALFIQVVVFAQVNFLVRVLIGTIPFSFHTLCTCMIPANYFVVLYSVVYCSSPFLNIVLNRMNNKTQWHFFIIMLLFIFSVWNTGVNLLNDVSGKEVIGLSTIGVSGTQAGMNIVNFYLMYILGAYLRICGIPSFLSKQVVTFLLWIICVLCILVWALLPINQFGLRSAWLYDNPFVIFSAFLLLCLFSSFTFYSGVINELSRAAFTCFLFHIRIINGIYDSNMINRSAFVLFAYLLSAAFCVYIFSYMIDKGYSFIISPFLKLIKRFSFISNPLFDSSFPPFQQEQPPKI